MVCIALPRQHNIRYYCNFKSTIGCVQLFRPHHLRLVSELESFAWLATSQQFTVDQLVNLFNTLFLESCNTRLIGGADEPLYLPAGDEAPCHRLYFRGGLSIQCFS